MLNHGSFTFSSSSSHLRPASLPASSASISSGERPSTNTPSMPLSMTSFARRRSSALGLKSSTSMPATICAMC
jgi:hypothetical protein